MGEIYDTNDMEYYPKCSDVKGAIIIINIAGASISFILLSISIIRMICINGLPFLTHIIIFIFSSEIVNTISKILQLLKYAFEDTRMNDDTNKIQTPRGVICQIQIVFSIISDFCSLLGTLLLSYRCYEIIKNKKRIFDKKKAQILSFVCIIVISIILAITFLMIDRLITFDSVTYKFDVRDRCTYWCWLDHITSEICYFFFLVILVLNSILAYKTNSYLRKSYKQLLEQSAVFLENNDKTVTKTKSDYSTLAPEDKKRIKELRIMRIKCFLYPVITIIIWIILTLYRVIDDFVISRIVEQNDKNKEADEENKFFEDHPGLRVFSEINLVSHTLLSAIRGILYGISFIIFEEKAFGNIFRNCCYRCCFRIEDLDDFEDNERVMNKVSMTPDELLMMESIGRESNEDDVNLKKNKDDFNTSDYNYNE